MMPQFDLSGVHRLPMGTETGPNTAGISVFAFRRVVRFIRWRIRGNGLRLDSLLVIVCGLSIGIEANVARGEEVSILPVPKLTIYPGDTIDAEWLVDREFTREFIATRPPLVDSRVAIVGKVARRTLLPGAPVPSNAVAERKLVILGAKVRIRFEDDGLSIVAFGTALQSGSVGALVQVRNLDSGITISGIVQEDGSVRVSGS
jgi:flagella basal body P-ring formation protein FlgA